jgi:hypothetical protein
MQPCFSNSANTDFVLSPMAKAVSETALNHHKLDKASAALALTPTALMPVQKISNNSGLSSN